MRADLAARLGGGKRVAGATAVVGEDLAPGAARCLWRHDSRHAGDRGDVGGDVGGVGAGDQLGRHVGGVLGVGLAGVGDLGLDDTLDRVGVEAAGGAGSGEGRVEVGADVGGRPSLGEDVAGAAVFDEEVAAVVDVSVLLEVAAAYRERGGKQADAEKLFQLCVHGRESYRSARQRAWLGKADRRRLRWRSDRVAPIITSAAAEQIGRPDSRRTRAQQWKSVRGCQTSS